MLRCRRYTHNAILVALCFLIVLSLFHTSHQPCIGQEHPDRVPQTTVIPHSQRSETKLLVFNATQKANRTVPSLDVIEKAKDNESEFKVPNIVHYIWYSNRNQEFRFDKALAVMSAIKYLKPDTVYFHTDRPPTGQHFDKLKENPAFKVIQRQPPRDAMQSYAETDYSNYDRVKVLIEYGGIYLDMDVMVIQSFNELRKYPCTVGLEGEIRVNGGVIICAKAHPFLYLWLQGYYDDHRRDWSYNSGTYPTKVWKRYPDLINIDYASLHEPGYAFLEKIWGKVLYPWHTKFAIHTWIRMAKQKGFLKGNVSPETIKTMNTTFGQMARAVYYGSADLIK